MRFSGKSILIIIGSVIISLVGLALIQVLWLQSAIDLNKKKFNDQVFKAATIVGRDYRMFIQKELYAITRNSSNTERKSNFENDFRAILTSEFNKINIEQPFEFGIMDRFNRLLVGEIQESRVGDLNKINYLCCYKLALDFPNKDSVILSALSWTLAPSILFIFILTGSFAYVIISLNRQKRIGEIKNDFINNLTHEFKTPLASISLASHVMRDKFTKMTKDKKIDYLRIINMESKRLERQIDKVLQMATIDSGNLHLELEENDIHKIINDVAISFDPTIKKNMGNLKLELNAERSFVKGDEGHLTNVLSNLVDNSIKYCKSKPTILVKTWNEKDEIVIQVKDNGIGIKREFQKNIFDKFYRIQSGNVHNTKGFGLGLNYVKSIIEAHKGKVEIISEVDHGTKINIYLPI